MSTAEYTLWIVAAFAVAASWGATVVINKRTLHYVDPIALNALLRGPALVILVTVTVALTLSGAWDLGFDLTWTAAGYIALDAVATWLIAFNTYFLALRLGRIGVVVPIMATDTLFTAIFALILLGTSMGTLLIAGLVVATAGVAILARETGAEPAASPDTPVGRPADVSAGLMAETGTRSLAGGRLGAGVIVVLLSLVTAAAWGFGPVMIELAVDSMGGPTSSMMIYGHGLGLVLMLPVAFTRRKVFVRPVDHAARRLVTILILVTAALEVFFAVFFFLLIDAIGSVLTVLIVATSPVFGIIGGVLFLKERCGRWVVFGAAVTLIGVLLATLDGM